MASPWYTSEYNDYFEFRAELLGPSRNRVLAGRELINAGTLIYGRPDGLALYGVPAPLMAARGLRLLGRTVIECSVDAYVENFAETIASPELGASAWTGGIVADLFCGSGNFGYHLGRRLGMPVHASEIDPLVYAATRHNFQTMSIDVRLKHTDYRNLLHQLPAPSVNDIYIIEPPWGTAFTEDGLDLMMTSPPVPGILADIQGSRLGHPCFIAIKTNDQISNDSLSRSFHGAQHLVSVTPPPYLPAGANMNFHLYVLPYPQV